ncbi:hypothetical protein A6R68_12650 [Neotoma lepida]|uniref:Keratinocyte differentiation-associated protein n=1 Tax=Neotoma lepida TaxID=56216 RepID=A0A1A6H398_NEOLE|nr:hypothetical protein A6R68_12650 [Neotoma lepida]
MKIPILPAVALLSLLALHAVQGAALGGAEGLNSQFLNLDKLQSMFKNALPFINWEAFPKDQS